MLDDIVFFCLVSFVADTYTHCIESQDTKIYDLIVELRIFRVIRTEKRVAFDKQMGYSACLLLLELLGAGHKRDDTAEKQ